MQFGMNIILVMENKINISAFKMRVNIYYHFGVINERFSYSRSTIELIASDNIYVVDSALPRSPEG